MSKWYDEVVPSENNYISSRIRLARNWEEYAFPNKLNTQAASELVGRLSYGLDDISKAVGENCRITTLDLINDAERFALKERRVLNSTTAAKKSPTGLIVSDSEDLSIILNGDDHIRMQFLASGLNLGNLYEKADKLDDYINSRFEYAFDEKYGYLTSYPTNVGTGMRANIVVHLPALSRQKNFQNLLEGMSRFGVTIKAVYGNNKDNPGSLFDISNSKTLGLSEKEITDVVIKCAAQLNSQEFQCRQEILKKQSMERLDDTYKSYGILKYARKLSLKDGLTYLSQLMAGISDRLVKTDEGVSIYRLMLGIQPYNIITSSDRPLNQDELDYKRADYIRKEIPTIKED